MKALALFLILFSCSSINNNRKSILKKNENKNFISCVKNEISILENNRRTINSLTVTNNNLFFENNNIVDLSGDLEANGYLTLNVLYYNVADEVMPGKVCAGQVYRLYAYSEGIIGLFKSSDIIGIKIKVTNQSAAGDNLANLEMNSEASNLLLANSRFLSNNQNSSIDINAHELAKWSVKNNNQKDLKATFKIEIIGIFGNGTTEIKSAQNYLGALEFYLVRENNESLLNSEDILNFQLSQFINNNTIYNRICGDWETPFNFQIHQSSTPQNITIKFNNNSFTIYNAKLSGGNIIIPKGLYFGYSYLKAIIKHNTKDYKNLDIKGYINDGTIFNSTYKN